MDLVSLVLLDLKMFVSVISTNVKRFIFDQEVSNCVNAFLPDDFVLFCQF